MSGARITAPPGLYVHFPYCDRRCPYCDFVLATPREVPSGPYTDALLAEWAARRTFEVQESLRTLYLGGGTPSLWDLKELKRFVTTIERDAPFVSDAERTIEANPEQVSAGWLDAILDLGFNRISLGVQSLDPQALASLGRVHGAEGAAAALDLLANAFQAGRLRSFSADLIYGWPGQSAEAWEHEFGTMVRRWAPPHLSLYALTVEPRTVLGKRVREGLAPCPDDGLQAAMMFSARARLAEDGYTHYEVSSWARPGFQAVHNALYWDMSRWVGLGAGAAGFTGQRRYRNQPVIRRYLVSPPHATEAESQVLDAADHAFDAVMTGLRRLDTGLRLPPPLEARFAAAIALEEARGRVFRTGVGDSRSLHLTDDGLRFMDDVLVTFLEAVETV